MNILRGVRYSVQILNFLEEILGTPGRFWELLRDFWRSGKAGFALFLISLFVIVYGCIALDYEIGKDWKGHESVQNVLKDISTFIPVGAAVVGMIIGGIDFMMLLSDWYIERQEKRIQAAKAEGKVEGKVEGMAEGEARVYQEIAAWDTRRREADARGETFTESPPAPPDQKVG